MRYSLLVVLVLVGCSRYDYIERNGATLRVDKLSGKMQAMQRSSNGGVVWTAVKTAADVDEERTRCAIRRLPSIEQVRVRVRNDGNALTVNNRSDWFVTTIAVRTARGEASLTRFWDDGHPGPPDLSPGTWGYFASTPRTTLPSQLTIDAMYGTPGDCVKSVSWSGIQ